MKDIRRMTENKSNQIETWRRDGLNLSLHWAILVVGQKLEGEIIIYLSKQLFIPEKNSNSISFDQSHTIKEKKKKKYLINIIKKSWYTTIKK